MNAATLRVEFDPCVRKEVEEAKRIYQKAKREGRIILSLGLRAVRHFGECVEGFVVQATAVRLHEFAMRIFDESGDRRVIWDARDPAQIAEAARLFQSYLDRGWKAYTVEPDGTLAHRIRHFDADTEEIVYDDTPTQAKLHALAAAIPARPAPATSRQRLAAFVEACREVHLLPATYPG